MSHVEKSHHDSTTIPNIHLWGEVGTKKSHFPTSDLAAWFP